MAATARSFLLVLLLALVLGVSSCQRPPGACDKDPDCPAGQVCSSGRCQWPLTAKLGPRTVVVGEEEVAGKQPNAWGLHDMAGNVWEWCHDWWADHLGTSPVLDPAGPPTGIMRASRGGCYAYSATWARAAYRQSYSPGSREPIVGLRCARTIL